MSFEYISLEQAQKSNGVRMVVSRGIPNPWAEAAKGILHLKHISWQAVYLDHGNAALTQWAGMQSAPVLIHDQAPPLHYWLDILEFAELHGTGPALLPENTQLRQQVLDVSRRICDPKGLGWYRRLSSVAKGVDGLPGGFPDRVARYLGEKYGYQPSDAHRYQQEVIAGLQYLNHRLAEQKKQGSAYLVGDRLSAADIYSACFMAYFKPLDERHCAMIPMMRTVFESMDDAVFDALGQALMTHRDFIYQEFLELPLML